MEIFIHLCPVLFGEWGRNEKIEEIVPFLAINKAEKIRKWGRNQKKDSFLSPMVSLRIGKMPTQISKATRYAGGHIISNSY